MSLHGDIAISRATALVLLAVLLVSACVARLPYIDSAALGADEALYAWSARRLLEDPTLVFSREIIEYHPPLFPLILSAGRIVFPENLSDRLTVLLISLAGIVMIYLLGARCANRFVGLFVAAALGFNYLYLINSVLIHNDVPQTVLFILLLWLLASRRPAGQGRRDAVVGLCAAAIFFLKWTGLIVIPFLLFYYLVNRMPPKRTVRTLGVVLAFVFLYYLAKFLATGSVLPDVQEMLTGGERPGPFYYYLLNLHNILGLPHLIPLFFYGIYCLAKSGDGRKHLLLGYLAVTFVSVSTPAVKILRYALPLLPAVLVVTGIGLNGMILAFFKSGRSRRMARLLVLGLTVFSFWILLPRTVKLMDISFSTSTGLKETGRWIREREALSDTLIIAQNHRPIRYFSGMNYRELGGRIVPLPRRNKDFESLLRSHAGRVLVVVDIWSESVSSDLEPFSRKHRTDIYFRDLGLRLIKVITAEVYPEREKSKIRIPAVKIYERGPL